MMGKAGVQKGMVRMMSRVRQGREVRGGRHGWRWRKTGRKKGGGRRR